MPVKNLTKPPPPKSPPPPSKSPEAASGFVVAPWTGKGEGEKLIAYGSSGKGKTTLAALAPRPVFIGVDDGGRKIRDPRTGDPLYAVKDVRTFQGVRDVLAQPKLFKEFKSIVIDTATYLEVLAETYMFANIKHEKGYSVDSIEGYGYGKGYKHLYDTMRLILQDLDQLVQAGFHVIVLCQNAAVKRANAGGEDFLEDGPKLSHPATEKHSVRLHYVEWADHVIKIDYKDVIVTHEGEKKPGKIMGETERAIFTMPEPHFFAKTRTLTESIVSFSRPNDDTFWQILLGENNN